MNLRSFIALLIFLSILFISCSQPTGSSTAQSNSKAAVEADGSSDAETSPGIVLDDRLVGKTWTIFDIHMDFYDTGRCRFDYYGNVIEGDWSVRDGVVSFKWDDGSQKVSDSRYDYNKWMGGDTLYQQIHLEISAGWTGEYRTFELKYY